MPNIDIRFFPDVETCWRSDASGRAVAPSRQLMSRSTSSAEAPNLECDSLARKYAAALPTTTSPNDDRIERLANGAGVFQNPRMDTNLADATATDLLQL